MTMPCKWTAFMVCAAAFGGCLVTTPELEAAGAEAAGAEAAGAEAAGAEDSQSLRGVLRAAEQLNRAELERIKQARYNSVILPLGQTSAQDSDHETRVAELILESGLHLYYWIEIGRNSDMADAHPRWMASLQGHHEWQRLHPDFSLPAGDDRAVVKNYPWVPILYEEAFAAHISRVTELLRQRPAARGIFLNDLQGGPSACGCGNTLCRWTADYGPIKTATSLGDDAAARFVSSVQRLVPASEIIPVWVTECEQHDGARDGACAGVGCFEGICWKAYVRQLTPVLQQSKRLGVLLPLREFQRELPVFPTQAGWIRQALDSFEKLLPRRGGGKVEVDRLIPIVQGWDIEEALIDAQLARAQEAGTENYVVARMKIEQGWKPQIYRQP
jgi:hypothetical protein